MSCRRKGGMGEDWLAGEAGGGVGGSLLPERIEREAHVLAGKAKDLPEQKSGPAW